MKVEEYVEEILTLVRNSRFDKLVNRWTLLEQQLKFSDDVSKKQSYWKVCQALGELGVNLLLQKACSDSTNDKAIAVLCLFHAGRTTAMLRRLLQHRDALFLSLHDLIHEPQCTSHYFVTLNYTVAVLYRCLLVGKLEDAHHFLTMPFLDDFYEIVGALTTHELHSLGIYHMSVILRCTKVLQLLAETGDDEILMTVQKKEADRRLFRQLHITMNLDRLKDISKDTDGIIYVSRLLDFRLWAPDSPWADTMCIGLAKMPRSQRLEKAEFPDSFIFCSSPDCRKLQGVDDKLQHCAACMLARYCSQECQKRHWLHAHKTQCQTMSGHV